MISDIEKRVNQKRITDKSISETSIYSYRPLLQTRIFIAGIADKSMSKTRIYPYRPLLETPIVVASIRTDFGTFCKELGDILCMTDNRIWTCGYNNDSNEAL